MGHKFFTHERVRISGRYHLNCRLHPFCMDNITHCCCISLELGEVGQDNFSVGQKLVPGGVEFRLESLSFLPRELFMVS